MFYPFRMSTPDPTLAPNLRRPGRAAASNRTGRFEPCARVVVDDGWDIPEDTRLARTEVALERPRRVISRNASPDLPFDRSLNPYRGCEHGCIYCYARPSHAWLGLSPGLDFETRLIARPTAPEALRRELLAPGYRVAPLAIGTNTDPYQPIEARHGVMRGVLEVLRDFNHPVAVTTKGALVERDLDILGEMGRRGLAQVGVSITTLDAALSRALEPRAPAPARRLEVIRRLVRAGCPVRLMLAPVIPGLTDHELESIVAAAAGAGAGSAEWILLRLPGEVRDLFAEWLAEHRPGRAAGVMARLREMHGGREYDSRWGKRMRGDGVQARLIAQRFDLAVRRAGLARDAAPLRCDLFRVPGQGEQLDLF